MKKFLFVLLMLGCVALAAVFIFLEKLDGMVQKKIESVGTETLGQSVTVEGVNIELTSGMGEITGLRIENPEGFADENAFEMERIRLGINLATLSQNPLVLNEFVLESPAASLEIREDGRSNLDEIIEHLRAQQADEPEEPEAAEADQEVPLFVIKNLKIAGVQLTLRHPKLGEEPEELVLPDIEVDNVGGEIGLSPAGLSLVIVEEIAKAGAKEALKTEVEKQAGKLLDKAGSSIMKRLNPEEKSGDDKSE